MKKLAFEAKMDWRKFNDSSECLSVVRNMLSAMREQMRDQEKEGDGSAISLSILVRRDSVEDRPN